MTNPDRAELHPTLQTDAPPSLAKLKRQALQQLTDTANTIGQLIELVRGLQGIKEPERWAPHYWAGEWFCLIGQRRYEEARQFLLAYHS